MITPEFKLLARVLYEIRIQLPIRLDGPQEQQFASRLAYALHNDAWGVVEGKSFDLQKSIERIEVIDKLIGGDEGKRLAQELRSLCQKES